jgi:hypothetical protein
MTLAALTIAMRVVIELASSLDMDRLLCEEAAT